MMRALIAPLVVSAAFGAQQCASSDGPCGAAKGDAMVQLRSRLGHLAPGRPGKGSYMEMTGGAKFGIPVTLLEDSKSSAPTAADLWNLDRIDSRNLPSYGEPYVAPGSQGGGVHVYVLDTGVNCGHPEFEGRCEQTLQVIDGTTTVCSPGSSSCAMDYDGHGTHCAGIIGGKTTGVAPQATIHAVKIMKDISQGDFTDVKIALEWIKDNGIKPAVVSMSIAGERYLSYIDTAISNLDSDDMLCVAGASNDGETTVPDACAMYPAGMPSAFTVGATTDADARWSKSNVGHCVDIFAPGAAVWSTAKTSGDYEKRSGTSMAAPHVAGAAALLLSENGALTSADLKAKLQSFAGVGKISDVDGALGDDTPNLLLYVGEEPQPDALPTEPPCQKQGAGWMVTSGSCCIDTSDNCLVSPGYPGFYPPSQDCEVDVTDSATLGSVTAKSFILEAEAEDQFYDYLEIDGTKIGGTTKMDDAKLNGVTPTGAIKFHSDHEISLGGFRLCPDSPQQVPTTAPTTPAPTTPAPTTPPPTTTPAATGTTTL